MHIYPMASSGKLVFPNWKPYFTTPLWRSQQKLAAPKAFDKPPIMWYIYSATWGGGG